MARISRRSTSALLTAALTASLLTVAAPPAQAADAETLYDWPSSLSEISAANSYVTGAYGPSITLDGDLSEWTDLPGLAGPSTPEQNTSNPWGGPADLSYEAHLGYDATNFYLGVKVTDDIHDPLPGGSNFSADGVQFAIGEGSTRVEIGVAYADGVNDVFRYSPGTATMPPSAIQLRGRRDATATNYEMVVPWRSVRSAAPEPGQVIPFTLKINERDGGTSRKGYVEWTKGIAGSKDVSKFGKLELLRPDQTWTTWMTGPEVVINGESAQYSLYVLNSGTSPMDLTLDLPALGIAGAPVAVPGRNLFRKTFTKTIDTTVDLVATLRAGSETRTAGRHVTAIKTAAQLTALLDQIDTVVIPRLAAKVDTAARRGIATDYERVNLTTIRKTSPYGREDVAHNLIARADYIVNSLLALADEAEQRLDGYLAGTARSLGPVPRYRTGKTRVDGYSVRGTTTAGRDKPLIFSGYGMFEQATADIPIFEDLGNNIIDFNVYPLESFKQPGLSSWTQWTANAGTTEFALDDTQAHSGDVSARMRMSGGDSIFYQEPVLKPDTAYQVTAWTRTEGLAEAHLYSNHNGWATSPITPSADWTQQQFTFTTGPGELRLQVGVYASQAGTLWIDDYSLTEVGSTTNLMANPGFESGAPTDTYYVVDETYLNNNVDPALRSAEQHDIAVNVELALQGFPDWIYQKYPDTKMQGNYGFLQADIENPRVQELYKAHVALLMKHVKDSPAVQAVNLSNESEYQQNLGPYNLAKWHEYLPKVYRSVQQMNQVWGTSYAGFADVPIPEMASVQRNALYFDYLSFKEQRLTAFHQMLADEVHKYAPTMPVHVKLMGFGVTNDDFMLRGGKDMEQMAALSDYTGIDGGPDYGGGSDKFAEYVGMLDMLTSMRRQPTFNSENHMIADGESRYSPDVAPWVSNWIWTGALHGTSASVIWVWQRDYQTDYLAGSILNRPDAIARVGQASLDLNRLIGEVTAFQNARADVAVLYSTTPRLYSDAYYDTMTKAYKALSYNGQKVGFVTEKQTATELNRYRVLVLPDVRNLSAGALRNIARFVRHGGRVVTIGDPATLLVRDGHNQPLSEKDRRTVLRDPRTLTVAAGLTDDELRGKFLGLLNRTGLADTMVYDAATNQPVRDMEWRTVRYHGRTLLSLVNYGLTKQTVYVKVHGHRVRPAKNLIDGTTNRGATVTLEGYAHAMYTLG